MNLFLITFVKHISDNMNKFINETVAFTEAREKYHLVLIHNVIKVFQEQLSTEAANMVNFDNTNLSQLLTELTQGIMKTIDNQKELAESMRKQSLQDIIKYLMEKQSEFAEDIIGTVGEYTKAHPVGPSPKPEFIPATTPSGSKDGYVFTTGPKGTGYYLNTSPMRREEFIPAVTFMGDKEGYEFKPSGDKGSGYYLKKLMMGGFPKDLSIFPQNFYSL